MSELNGPRKETVRITLPPRRNLGSDPRATTRISPPPPPPPSNGPASEAEPPRRVLPPPPPPKQQPPTISASAPPLRFAAPPPPPRPVASAMTPIRPAPPAPAVSSAPTPEPPPTPPAMPPRPRVLPPPLRVVPPSAAVKSVSAPENYPGTQAGLRKETARITILPEATPPPAATVKMAKTQPLMIVPEAKIQNAPVIVSSEPEPAPSSDFPAMLDAVPLPVCWAIFGISAVTFIIQIWNYFGS